MTGQVTGIWHCAKFAILVSHVYSSTLGVYMLQFIFLIFVNMACVEICVHIAQWKCYLNIFFISILQLREKVPGLSEALTTMVAMQCAVLSTNRETKCKQASNLVFYAQSTITVISGRYTFCQYTTSAKIRDLEKIYRSLLGTVPYSRAAELLRIFSIVISG